MHFSRVRILVFLLMVGAWLSFAISLSPIHIAHAQQPTVDIPTVTGTPAGPMVTVNMDQDHVNVRAGPGPEGEYEVVGILQPGEKAPAIGRSPGGDWIKIVYPTVNGGVGWVYAYLVTVTGGDLPIVEVPPTSTPRVTPTIDPTLAAQLVVDIGPTRLPTYTPPPPVQMPTYTQAPQLGAASGLPMGFIIIGMAVVGVFGLMISVIRGR